MKNVLDNLHGKIPLKICQSSLDELVDQKILQRKDFGPAKIYLACQDNFPEVNNDDLAQLD